MKKLLLALFAVLSCSLAYSQATIAPVVSPDSIGPDQVRPFSWVAIPADGSSTLNFVHGPGQTGCGISVTCYYLEGDIWTAYGLPPLQTRGHYGQGITIGIVDAYYDNQIQQNLVAFSNDFGLPGGTVSGSNYLFSFRRAGAAAPYNPVVQTSATLAAGSWTNVASGITVDSNFYGPGIDRVTATIPRTGKSKLFARLVITGL